MKKSIILCLLLVMIFAFSATASAEEITPAAEPNYYTVLVLDASGSHSFGDGKGHTIYVADPATNQVKDAATKFSDAILSLDGNHQIAVVSYAKYATTRSEFTDDDEKIKSSIKNISSGEENVNVGAGLANANALLSGIQDPLAIKNVVIFTTGMTNSGSHSASGKYNSSTPAHTWFHNTDGRSGKSSSEYYLYEYANAALAEAQKLHAYANVYSIGLFEEWNDMPQAGQELVTFFKMFTQDLANPLENFNPVYNKNDINGAFEQVCNSIIGNPFKDVTYSGYYFDAVFWAIEKNIAAGISASSFDPNATCTREQMVTFLWRSEGRIAPTVTSSPFKDIQIGSYSYEPILWATETGVTVGTGPDTFSPTRTVTREEVVTFLWRIAGKPQATTTAVFTDISPADYSYEAIRWAAENNITKGTTATTFGPKEPCKRAQIVTFLYRYYTGNI